MPDFNRIFSEATTKIGGFNQNGSFSGVGSIGVWRELFQDMRRRLELSGATPTQAQEFRNAIDRAIDAAHEKELTSEERGALRASLASAFDGNSRSVAAHLAPMAQFLGHVRFRARLRFADGHTAEMNDLLPRATELVAPGTTYRFLVTDDVDPDGFVIFRQDPATHQ